MASPEKIRCGVVGVGHLGQHHARIYAALSACDLAGVYDVNATQANEIATRYGCAAFDSLEALSKACDAVSVVTPTDRHCEVALTLLQKTCHLLIEKPLCVNQNEAERILSAAHQSGSIVQVGHIEHFNPVMDFLEGAVNKPQFITADRLAPYNIRGTEVGVVLDLMIHDIGIIIELVKSPITNIESVGVNVLSQTEDIANARLTFENGCVANINTSRVSQKKVREIRVFQPATYLSLDFMNQRGHLLRKDGLNLTKEDIPIEKEEPLMSELASFVNCATHYQEPKVSGLQGKSALEVAIHITEQIQNAR